MRLSILTYVARLSARPTRAENSVEAPYGSRRCQAAIAFVILERIVGGRVACLVNSERQLRPPYVNTISY